MVREDGVASMGDQRKATHWQWLIDWAWFNVCSNTIGYTADGFTDSGHTEVAWGAREDHGVDKTGKLHWCMYSY